MSISNLLQLSPDNDNLRMYVTELIVRSNLGWGTASVYNALTYIASCARSFNATTEEFVEANKLAANLLIMELYRNFRECNWTFTASDCPITEEGHILFSWNHVDGGEKYLILDGTTADILYDYLRDLEEEDDERNMNYDFFMNIDEIISQTSPQVQQYLIALGFMSESEVPVIPPNSESLLVREDTSRFSSATWYQAIQEKIITLAGVGGIGSYVGFLLARIHPKSMFIYDDDYVESANMSGQLYSRDDIGMAKVEALTRMVDRYANYESMFAINGRFTANSEPSDIMICGFDNMSSRALFFNLWKDHVMSLSPENRSRCLFIDGRLAAEELQVFAITGDNDWAMSEYQGKHLFSNEEADETICSYKQTTYMANLIGSLIVNIFVNFVANEVAGWDERDIPFFTSYDGLTMFFKTEK